MPNEGPANVLIDRQWIHAVASAWIDDPNEARSLFISGNRGAGKSTFIRQFVDHQSQVDRADILLLSHECRRGTASGVESWRFLRHVAAQLATSGVAVPSPHRPNSRNATVNLNVGVNLGTVTGMSGYAQAMYGTTLVESFIDGVLEPLKTWSETNPDKTAVIAVDGIDEPTYDRSASPRDLLRMLADLPSNVRFIIAGTNLPSLSRFLQELFTLRHLDISADSFRLNRDNDVRAWLGLAAPEMARDLPAAELDTLVKHSAGSLLYARTLLIRWNDREQGRSERPIIAADNLPMYCADLISTSISVGISNGLASAEMYSVLGILAALEGKADTRLIETALDIRSEQLYRILDALSHLIIVEWEDKMVSLIHPFIADYLTRPGPDHVDVATAHEALVDSMAARSLRSEWPVASSYERTYFVHHLIWLAANTRAGVQHVKLVASAWLAEDGYLWCAQRDWPETSEPRDALRVLLELLLDRHHTETWRTVIIDLAESPYPLLWSVAISALRSPPTVRQPRHTREVIEYLAMESRSSGALRVSLEAATSRGKAALLSVLQKVVEGSDQERRLKAAQLLYIFHAQDPAGLANEVLPDLAATASPLRPLHLLRVTDFLAHATITTYITNCFDPDIAASAAEVCRTVLEDRLRLPLLSSPRAMRRTVARVGAKPIARRVVEAVQQAPMGGATTIHRGEAESLRTLIDALDPATRLSDFQGDLIRALQVDNVLARLLAGQVLAVHAYTRFDEAQTSITYLVDHLETVGRIWVVIALCVLMPDAPLAWSVTIEAILRLVLQDAQSYHAYHLSDLSKFDILFAPLALAYCRADTAMRLHQEVIAGGDLLAGASAIAGIGVAGTFMPHQALAGLDHVRSAATRAGLDEQLVSAYAEIYSMYPAAAEAAILDGFGSAFLGLVRSEAVGSNPGRYVEAIGLYSNGVHQAVNYPIMREGLLKSFYLAMLDGRPSRALGRYAASASDLLSAANYDPSRWFIAGAVP